MEAGRVELQIAPVDLGQMIEGVAVEFAGQLHGRDVRLLADVPHLMATVQTDPERLRQVLINLIGNAIKFTEHGTVTVRVLTAPVMRIDVIDTGIGIARDKQALIFEAFRQADSTTTRRFGGTGLGLTISQALCQLMGYRLEVQSEEGRGSTFSIVLNSAGPVAGDLTPSASVAEPAPLADPPARLVLVIDDEEDARSLLVRMVMDFG